MKKTLYIVLSIASLFLIFSACNKRKTYAELLKDETKAIDKFVAQNKLVILKSFPATTGFKDNEFYRDPATGVYYNIVEWGDTTIKAKEGDEVYIRFSGLRYFSQKKDSTEYSNMDPIRSPFPETFIYRGPVSVRNRSLYASTTPGWAVPLPKVGQAAKVKMIVPFNMGSSSDQAGYTPTYYNNVEYRFGK